MQRLKLAWKRLPNKPRRVLTFIVGALLIITSGLIGWIPGPGGMIPFLLGIAVLATEFTWAEKFRDSLLASLKTAGTYVQTRPWLRALLIIASVVVITVFGYVLFTQII